MEKIQYRVNRMLESLQELEVGEINYTISTEEFAKYYKFGLKGIS